jgi:hydrogenase maturation protein HypF
MDASQRLRVTVRGAVQGVGFRPFVYRLASELSLQGWVNNSTRGVFIEVEGDPASLEAFRLRLEREKPPRAFIQSIEASRLDPVGFNGFEIRASETDGEHEALVLPDIATCPDCLREILDPHNRRYRYPFTNCTNCGPRFTIIEALPYDRPATSMKGFAMCPACRAEYENPADRRFHAQPNACAACGPQLALWDGDGHILAREEAALQRAVEAVRRGGILALKGIGGFHIVCDARPGKAVRELRRRKAREEKPLACMFPTLASVRLVCAVSDAEERLLLSPESPIVLLHRLEGHGGQSKPAPGAASAAGSKRTTDGEGKGNASVAPELDPAIAPGNPYLGIMLPYTPLHHLLLSDLGFAIVATSGNRSEEPICTDEREVLERLSGIADLFLVHDRPIVRHADDSIIRLCAGRELVLRRARGFAPLPVPLHTPQSTHLDGMRPAVPGATAAPVNSPRPAPVLAVGAFLKSTVAVASGTNAFVGQHIGDLATLPARTAFMRAIGDLTQLFSVDPAVVACDLHPDYPSTRHAHAAGLPIVGVQHHEAHALACMAENELDPPVLAVSWDGTGYGHDGTVWGGEFLRVTEAGCERVAHLRTFRLPGGEQAVREPRRSALGVLHAMLAEGACQREDLAAVRAFSPAERRVLCALLRKGLNAPLTSSAGRLFDAVAALLDLQQTTRFEGQAAMALEFAARTSDTRESYAIELAATSAPPWVLDWEPLVEALLGDGRAGVAAAVCARKFHHALADAVVAVAQAVSLPRVVLSGGCFQNVLLTECTIQRLRAAGFQPYWHQRVPPNDGGVALGQLVAARRALARRGQRSDSG